MDPVSASTVVSRPPAVVFDYLADIANHPEFLDHWFEDWRLTREDTYGRGAGARFKLKQRRNRFPWLDQTFVEVVPPRKIVAVGRSGKLGRNRMVTEWEVEPSGSGDSRVTLTTETVPKLPSDKLLEVVWGTRGMTKRRAKRALDRLRDVLELDERSGARATIAGGARKPATGTPLR